MEKDKEAGRLGRMKISQIPNLRKDRLLKAINRARLINDLSPIADFLDKNPDVVLPPEIAAEIKNNL